MTPLESLRTMSYPIEKGIPIPVASMSVIRFPFRQMEVGDSIFIPENEATQNYRQCLASFFNASEKPKRFSGRSVEGGTRIWRTA